MATDPEARDRATRLYNMYWRYKSRLVRGSLPAGDTHVRVENRRR